MTGTGILGRRNSALHYNRTESPGGYYFAITVTCLILFVFFSKSIMWWHQLATACAPGRRFLFSAGLVVYGTGLLLLVTLTIYAVSDRLNGL
ncbi:MAG: hypothetical protein PF961_23270 [Planctomycetota bacterium]|nr:hypothetical protein [Planctomycetota bacterium]